MRFSRALVAFGIAAGSAACSLFVDLSGLNGGAPIDEAGSDASMLVTDSGADAVVTKPDGSVDFDAGTPFDCKSIDATFCDDFNRNAVAGSPVWAGSLTVSQCHLSVNGTLVTNADPIPDNGGGCLLYSTDNAPQNRHLTLEFDVNFSSNSSSPGIAIAEVDNDVDTVRADGVESQFFQILMLGSGAAKLGFLEYYPDAAASPDPGNSFPYWAITGEEQPFIVPNTPCHVSFVVDTIASSATATATCEGHAANVLSAVDAGAPAGFLAKPKILFGYDNTGVNAPAWSLAYDNMVFRSTP